MNTLNGFRFAMVFLALSSGGCVGGAEKEPMPTPTAEDPSVQVMTQACLGILLEAEDKELFLSETTPKFEEKFIKECVPQVQNVVDYFGGWPPASRRMSAGQLWVEGMARNDFPINDYRGKDFAEIAGKHIPESTK